MRRVFPMARSGCRPCLVRPEQRRSLEAALSPVGLPVAALMKRRPADQTAGLLAQPRAGRWRARCWWVRATRCRRAGGCGQLNLAGVRRADLVPFERPRNPGRRTQGVSLLVGDPP